MNTHYLFGFWAIPLITCQRDFLYGTSFAEYNRGDIDMEAWEIIQNCELAPESGLYGKRKFISAINELSPDQFNRFCRTYLHLIELHTFVKNLYFTEDTDFIELHRGELKQLDDIDFEAPVTFNRVK